jgi:hypothetical protein
VAAAARPAAPVGGALPGVPPADIVPGHGVPAGGAPAGVPGVAAGMGLGAPVGVHPAVGQVAPNVADPGDRDTDDSEDGDDMDYDFIAGRCARLLVKADHATAAYGGHGLRGESALSGATIPCDSARACCHEIVLH